MATVNAIQLDKEKGKLTLLNSQLVGEGAPCYIRVSPNGRFLLTANYMGGSISVFPIEKDGEGHSLRRLFICCYKNSAKFCF